MESFLRHRGRAAGKFRRPDSASARTLRRLRLAGWLVVPALLLLAAGCGGGSDKKQKAAAAVADSEPAQEEEKTAPAAEEAAAPVVKRKVKKVAEKPVTPEPPGPSTKDFTKWEVADLNGALARKDLRFVLAVVMFSARNPDDAKRAEELESLLSRVAKWKDDPAPIPLALPPGAFGAAGSPPHAAAAAAPEQQPKAAAAAPEQPKAAAATAEQTKGAPAALKDFKLDFSRRRNSDK